MQFLKQLPKIRWLLSTFKSFSRSQSALMSSGEWQKMLTLSNWKAIIIYFTELLSSLSRQQVSSNLFNSLTHAKNDCKYKYRANAIWLNFNYPNYTEKKSLFAIYAWEKKSAAIKLNEKKVEAEPLSKSTWWWPPSWWETAIQCRKSFNFNWAKKFGSINQRSSSDEV